MGAGVEQARGGGSLAATRLVGLSSWSQLSCTLLLGSGGPLAEHDCVVGEPQLSYPKSFLGGKAPVSSDSLSAQGSFLTPGATTHLCWEGREGGASWPPGICHLHPSWGQVVLPHSFRPQVAPGYPLQPLLTHCGPPPGPWRPTAPSLSLALPSVPFSLGGTQVVGPRCLP